MLPVIYQGEAGGQIARVPARASEPRRAIAAAALRDWIQAEGSSSARRTNWTQAASCKLRAASCEPGLHLLGGQNSSGLFNNHWPLIISRPVAAARASSAADQLARPASCAREPSPHLPLSVCRSVGWANMSAPGRTTNASVRSARLNTQSGQPTRPDRCADRARATMPTGNKAASRGRPLRWMQMRTLVVVGQRVI